MRRFALVLAAVLTAAAIAAPAANTYAMVAVTT